MFHLGVSTTEPVNSCLRHDELEKYVNQWEGFIMACLSFLVSVGFHKKKKTGKFLKISK